MKKRLVQILCAILLLSVIAAMCIIPVFGNESVTTASATTVTLADQSTTWKYLDTNTDPAAGLDSPDAWTLADYDDSAWKSASGSFGSKNGALAAVNGLTPTVLLPLKGDSDSSNYMAYFFRTSLTVENIDSISALSMSVNADDAVVVYVNGNVILDTRTAKDDTTSLHYAGTSVNASAFWLDSSELSPFLTEGNNIIAASVHNSNATSSDIYFDLSMSATYRTGGFVTSFENIIMGVGSDETQRTINWYTTSSEAGEIQWAPVSAMADGVFPTDYSSASANSSKADNSPGDYANKATLTGLEENTEYVYRLKNGSKYSKLYYFTVGSFGDYDFIVLGDPQIRSYSFSYATTDVDYWIETLDKVEDNFDAEFLITVGDQINTKNYEEEYDGFITDHLNGNAVATTIGNHDTGSTAYSDHFNMPNVSNDYGVNATGADYWFVYGNTLFLNLNYWGDSVTNHAAFMEEAIKENPDCLWQVAIMHISPFSAGSHANDSDVTEAREALTPYMNELGIDVVLGGHDHIYTRSYLMDGYEIAANQSNIDAEGVLYLCTGATGGKFYTSDKVNSGEGYEYVAYTFYDQSRVIVHFAVTDTSLSLNTYLVDDMSLIDSYTLAKSATSELKEAISLANDALTAAEGNLPDSYLTDLRAAVASGEAILADFENTSAEDLVAAIQLLKSETAILNAELESYNTLSAGAKETGADTAAGIEVIHLEAGGSYSLSGGGASTAISLVKNNTDGSTTTVLTWTEGSSSSTPTKNPYVGFILDGDVTFTGSFNWFFSNIVVDLNGNDLSFTSGSAVPVLLSNAASFEVRGEGNLIWGSGTSNNYLVQGNHYYSTLILNGDITLIDRSTSGRYPFYLKGNGTVHGTLTIDASFDSTSGYVFYIQGSRSSADERSGVITLDGATVNYNSTVGSPLFYAKGISGEYNGVTYTSIPKVNIINSRVNLKSPLATSKWGQDSVSGYATSKSEALTNCVNMTELNIENSYIYADFFYNASSSSSKLTVFAPSGYTTVNVTNSTIYAECGTIFRTTTAGKLTVNANGSTFYAGTTDAESVAIGAELSMSGSAALKGVILVPTASTIGNATFANCTLKAEYRLFDGGSNDVSTSTYFITCTGCELVVDTAANGGGGHIAVRSNVIIDGGTVDCGSGGITYKSFPYNSESGVGVLVKGPVVLINFPYSGIATYAKTVSEYKEQATTDSTVYTTQLSSNYFTIEDGTVFTSITYDGTLSSRYAYRLTRPITSGYTILGNLTLYTDFLYNLYIPVGNGLSTITVDGTEYTDLTTLPIADVDGASYYVVSVKVAVAEAARSFDVTVVLTQDDGTPLRGKWSVGVVSYLDRLLESDESDTAKALAKDILSYIRAAYAYAGLDTEAIYSIDAIIGENYDSTSTPDTSVDKAESLVGLYSASLELGDSPAFRFYIDGSYDASLYSFTVNGAAVDTEVLTDADNRTYILVSLYAYAMTDTVSYTIEGTDISGEYNLKAYYEFALTENDESLVSLVERLWKYSESAKAYRAEANA